MMQLHIRNKIHVSKVARRLPTLESGVAWKLNREVPFRELTESEDIHIVVLDEMLHLTGTIAAIVV
jgi:hypothetical protein